MSKLSETVKRLQGLLGQSTSGDWYIDCGVSQRSGWAIRSSDEVALHLYGGRNTFLDGETGKVEVNQDLICELHNHADWLLSIVAAAVEDFDAGQEYVKLDLAKLNGEKTTADLDAIATASMHRLAKYAELAGAIVLAKYELEKREGE